MAGTQWGNKKYMNMKHLEAAVEGISIADLTHTRTCKTIREKALTLSATCIFHNLNTLTKI
jgi:hypothetical protein